MQFFGAFPGCTPDRWELYRPWEGGWVSVTHIERGVWVNRGDFLIYRLKTFSEDRCRRLGCLIHLLHEQLVAASPYEAPLPVPAHYVDRRTLT